jgi:hypothetical protein
MIGKGLAVAAFLLGGALSGAAGAQPAAKYSAEQLTNAIVQTIADFSPTQTGGQTGPGFIVLREQGDDARPVEGYLIASVAAGGHCQLRITLGPSWNGGKRTEFVADFAKMDDMEPSFDRILFAYPKEGKTFYELDIQGATSIGTQLMVFSRELFRVCHQPG